MCKLHSNFNWYVIIQHLKRRRDIPTTAIDDDDDGGSNSSDVDGNKMRFIFGWLLSPKKATQMSSFVLAAAAVAVS